MIIAKNLSKYFGEIKAVDGVDFNIKKGEVVGLLGPNGAGKTTLMRLITGYLEPTSGEVGIYDFNDKADRIESLKQIGYVPENCPLYTEMTVYEFLKFTADLRRVESTNIEKAVEELGLTSVINQKIETLSKGYKRRVGIAAGIIHRPKILILDEPTEGLDPNQKFDIRNFIKNYGTNSIVIISTHIMEEVEAITSRVLLLNEGKLIKDITPKELKKLSPEGDVYTAFRNLTKKK